jgi:hypothetical protein
MVHLAVFTLLKCLSQVDTQISAEIKEQIQDEVLQILHRDSTPQPYDNDIIKFIKTSLKTVNRCAPIRSFLFTGSYSQKGYFVIATHFVFHQEDIAEVIDHVRGRVFEAFSSGDVALAVQALRFVAACSEDPRFSEFHSVLPALFSAVIVDDGLLIQFLKILRRFPAILALVLIKLLTKTIAHSRRDIEIAILFRWCTSANVHLALSIAPPTSTRTFESDPTRRSQPRPPPISRLSLKHKRAAPFPRVRHARDPDRYPHNPQHVFSWRPPIARPRSCSRTAGCCRS